MGHCPSTTTDRKLVGSGVLNCELCSAANRGTKTAPRSRALVACVQRDASPLPRPRRADSAFCDAVCAPLAVSHTTASHFDRESTTPPAFEPLGAVWLAPSEGPQTLHVSRHAKLDLNPATQSQAPQFASAYQQTQDTRSHLPPIIRSSTAQQGLHEQKLEPRRLEPQRLRLAVNKNLLQKRNSFNSECSLAQLVSPLVGHDSNDKCITPENDKRVDHKVVLRQMQKTSKKRSLTHQGCAQETTNIRQKEPKHGARTKTS